MTVLNAVREEERDFHGLLGTHPCMTELYDGIERAGRLDAPVVVWGPTGSGKELVARAVHRLSPVASGPFCAVNVAALPGGVVESELFGAVRGAFTGAAVNRPGLVESAEGGTLFLDEAGDLPPPVQAKLLRALDYGEVRRVGATKACTVKFRLLVALQDEPAVLERTRRWRADFYYRVTAVLLRVPPLSERRSDIPRLVRVFLVARGLPGISSDAMDVLVRHAWPGNVRELHQTLLRAAFHAGAEIIGPAHVQRSIGGPSGRECTNLAAARAKHVRETVDACDGNTRQAAMILGISRRHVYRLLKDTVSSLRRGGFWR